MAAVRRLARAGRGDAQPMVGAGAKSGDTTIFRKTKMCRFNLMGRCAREGACMFAHTSEELQPLPDFSYTKLCPELCETGRCEKGGACAFAHSTKELRTPKRRAKDSAAARRVEPVPKPLHQTGAEAFVVVLPRTLQPMVFAQALLMPCAAQQPAQPGEAAAGGTAAAAAEAATGGTAAGAAAAEVRPAAEDDRPQANGAGRDDELGAGSAELPPPPMHDPEVNLDALKHALDTACSKASADELDMEPNAWSRQSTEEDGIEEPLGAFSRQSTEEPWPSLDKAEASISEAPRPDVAARLGVERSVVRTFLEFREVGAEKATARRARSTS